MKKKNFRILAFIMMAVMLVTSIDTWGFIETAYASDDEENYLVQPTTVETLKADGDDGELTWSINNDGVLLVEGYGIPKNLKAIDCSYTPEKGDKLNVWPWYEHKDKITSAEISLGNVASLKAMFCECANIQKINFINIDSSKVSDMSFMFAGCSSLNIDGNTSMDGFDTKNVTNMSYLFYGCYLDEKAISGFNTSLVTDMTSMFEKASMTEVDLSSFNTSKVTNMKNMFKDCRSLGKIDASVFDTSSVTDMSGMFNGCEGIASIDISGFNTSKVKHMDNMFNGCTELQKLDLSNFDCSLVETYDNMFYDNLSMFYFKAPYKSSVDIKFLKETSESTPELIKIKDLNGVDYESVPKVVSANAIFFVIDPAIHILTYKEDHKDCKLTVKKNENVTVIPDSRIFDNIFYDSVTIRVRPDAGYEIESLWIDGENQGAVKDYQLVFEGKDHTVEAKVKVKTKDDDEYKALVDAGGGESVLTNIIIKNGKAYNGDTNQEITEEDLNSATKKGEAFEGYFTKDGIKITLDNIVEIVKKGEQIYARFATINIVVGQSANINVAMVYEEGKTEEDVKKYQVFDENKQITKAVKKLATVNKKGCVKAKKAGNIVVVGCDDSGKVVASVSLKLVPMKADKTKIKSVKLGLPGLSANMLDMFSDAFTNSNKIKWTVKGKIATINEETGLLTVKEDTVRSGKVTITAEVSNTAASDDYTSSLENKSKKFKMSISIKLPKQGGKTIKVKAGATKKCSLKNTTGLDVKWSSEDTSIAEVDENGVVKGKASGQTTTVTALVSKDGVEKTYNYTVKVK